MCLTRLVVIALLVTLGALTGAVTAQAATAASSGDCAYVGSDPSVQPEECLSSGGSSSASAMMY